MTLHAAFALLVACGSDPDQNGPIASPVDADGDGFPVDDDCDDLDPFVNPAAVESCDDIDNDCDGTIDAGAVDAVQYYSDTDSDTYGGAAVERSCEPVAGATAISGDCDDESPSVHPDAAEVCDDLDTDEDCDGLADDADDTVDTISMNTFYADADGDGHGDASVTVLRCDVATGWSESADDCEDTNAAAYPGADEVCDGADNDCDGDVDVGAIDRVAYYVDDDADGYGAGEAKVRCEPGPGMVTDTTDCNDANAAVNPGAVEVCDYSHLDEDCNGLEDDDDPGVDLSSAYLFSDGDADYYGDPTSPVCDGGVFDTGDCDDSDPAVNPAAVEVCDALDNDCDGTVDMDAIDIVKYFPDADGDGYGAGVETLSCTPLAGQVADETDCDDGDATIHRGATEVCDTIDNDCDGRTDVGAVDTDEYYPDLDGDSYGDAHAAVALCASASGYVTDASDCEDGDDTVHPGVDEVCGNGLDDNCDGSAGDCPWSGDLDVADASATITGKDSMMLGISVAAAGDTNGDGIADLLAGTNGGSAFLFEGPVSTTTVDDATATFTGPLDDAIGYHVTSVGDQDGDGYDDIALPAVGLAGSVYVVRSPNTGGAVTADVASATITGDWDDWFGWAPASGDLTDDKTPDLVFGAPYAERTRGIAYLFYGPISGDLGSADADATVTGESESYDETWGSFVGTSNAADGDVDGDGVNDWLIGTWSAAYGSALLYYGPVAGALSEWDCDVSATGDWYEGLLGDATSIAGDVDGDGRDDVVFSAPREGTNDEGVVWMFSGTTVAEESVMDIDAPDAELIGDGDDRIGDALDSSSDFDGNGADDLITTAGTDVLGFYGPVSGSVTVADASFAVASSSTYDFFSVGYVGDVDDDGADDLAIGDVWTPTGSPSGPTDGSVYLFFAGVY